ncbi:tetratricopeptide repeat protein [Anaeromyxobacter oryzisoli]|uniref:tetratricopeptide repeat protein n=1 Tax=Anaeromyxobacter oryzisoli TaxID=2925408 RepID=UPI001F5A76F3|nr:tetratricopeptide repeat protein [Anaeromyxobacter sp. SG63]
MARRGGVDEVDEEFLFHLNRGSDLLARGDADAARASLERALELRPKDAKVLGLLGQAFYKLGQYEDATIAWQRLVDDNPVEPAARVNLGLAFLKAKQYPEATRQLEIALDLNPEHTKAMRYLGLALLESGDASRARGWFAKAGAEQLVVRCDEILAGADPSSAAPTRTPAPEPHVEVEVEAEPAPAPEPLATPAPASLRAVSPAAAAERVEAGGAGAVAAPPGVAGVSVASAAAGANLTGYAAERAVPVARAGFAVAGGVLSVAVAGEVRVRLDGLLAVAGRIAVEAERKRFRGRPTEQAFGEGAAAVYRASGEGTLLLRTAGRRFTPLALGAEPAYLREAVVFGFEEGVTFENGRVQSSTAAELDLVLLRGSGRFLLVTAGEPVALDVAPDAPLRVPLAALVGWTGALTPRLTTLLEDGGAGDAAVELTGEGRVLVDPGAAGGPAGAAA